MTRLQQASNVGTASTIAVGSTQGWAAPLAGNLLLAWANADATVTINNSMTAGSSVVEGNGVYFWYKQAAGTETAWTFTLSGAAAGTAGVMEYDGNALSLPFDTSNSSTTSGTTGTSTSSVSITTAGAPGAIMVAIAGLHSTNSAGLPATPTWTNSFSNFAYAVQVGGSSASTCVTFVADRLVGADGTYSTSCSWSDANSGMLDRQEIVIAFDVAALATPDTPGNPMAFIGPTRGR